MIKFRVWDEDCCFMSDDLHFTIESINPISLNKLLNNENETLLQYTGLNDINGIEIYDGDIVRFKYPYDKRFKTIGAITWHNDKASFGIKIKETTEVYELYRVTAENYLEVIGNIYEDKELLSND